MEQHEQNIIRKQQNHITPYYLPPQRNYVYSKTSNNFDFICLFSVGHCVFPVESCCDL